MRRSKGLILLYHRVAELRSDPQLLCVSPQNFAEHLRILAERYRPIPLLEMVQRVRAGALPDRAVAVTFDDGYADNLHTAAPLLERFAVPATFFLTTGFIGANREFWWDELERLLLMPGRLPPTLDLRLGRKTQRWHLGASASYDADDMTRHREWNVERRDNPTPRHLAYRQLCQALRTLSIDERTAALNRLAASVDTAAGPRATHAIVTLADVARLASGSGFDIGAHTVSHPALSAFDAAVQQSEIAGAKTALEGFTSRPVNGFAYPFGGRSDYDRLTVQLVRNADYTWACSARPGTIGPAVDSYQLPRIGLRNCDGPAFAARLSKWL